MNTTGRTDKLVDIVRGTLERCRMIERGSVVVVGVSGGPDSVALLHVLHTLRAEMDFRMVAAHLDHCLRPESAQDAAFVQELAKALDVRLQLEPCRVAERATALGLSVEEAGRRERYAFFERVRSECGGASIATAHHRDDALETFFLRILRGSSIQGLTGIPAQRHHIVRPLIDAGRSDIMTFLHQHNLLFRIDRTNLESDTDRNFIRNRVFPVLCERFPDFRGPLTRTAEMIRDEDAYIGQQAERLFRKSLVEAADGLDLNLQVLRNHSAVLQARVILLALYRIFGPNTRWSRSHVRSILKLADSRHPSKALHMPGRLMVTREEDRLKFSAADRQPEPDQLMITVTEPSVVAIPDANVCLSFRIVPAQPDLPIQAPELDRVFFDADLVPFPLVLRNFRPGDRIRPWGLAGTRKVKKIFIEAKTPLRLRRIWPLLVKDNDILWIPGVRRSAAAAVRPYTARVLEVAITEAHNESD